MLKAGDRLWNGAIVTRGLANAYNALEDKIARFRAAGLPVPEHLLNGAHNLIASAPAPGWVVTRRDTGELVREFSRDSKLIHRFNPDKVNVETVSAYLARIHRK